MVGNSCWELQQIPLADTSVFPFSEAEANPLADAVVVPILVIDVVVI